MAGPPLTAGTVRQSRKDAAWRKDSRPYQSSPQHRHKMMLQQAKQQALIPTKNGLPVDALCFGMQKCIRRGMQHKANEVRLRVDA